LTFLMIFGFVAAALLVYAVIQSRATAHQYYIIPMALATVIGITFFYNTVLGYPTTDTQKSKPFDYLSYYTDGETIFIWVLHDEEDEPRSYAKPYSEDLQAKLEAGNKAKGEGKIVKGEFEEEQGPVGEEQTAMGSIKSKDGALELYDIDPAKFLPRKDPKRNDPPSYLATPVSEVLGESTSMGGP